MWQELYCMRETPFIQLTDIQVSSPAVVAIVRVVFNWIFVIFLYAQFRAFLADDFFDDESFVSVSLLLNIVETSSADYG